MTTRKSNKLAEIEHRLRVAKATDILTLAQAHKNVEKATVERYSLSAIMLTIRDINNPCNIIMEEVAISGLSPNTIAALQADIKRTYDERINHPMCKIKGG